jgi:hypothetical protein
MSLFFDVTRTIKSISELKASEIGGGTLVGVSRMSVALASNATHVEVSVVTAEPAGAFYFSATLEATKRCFKRAVNDAVGAVAASFAVREAHLSLPFLLMEPAESAVRAYWSIADPASSSEVLGFVPLRAASLTHNIALTPLLHFDAPPALTIAVDIDRNALLPRDPLLDDLFTKMLRAIADLALAAKREWRLVALPNGISAAPKTTDDAARAIAAALKGTPPEHTLASQIVLERDAAIAARFAAATLSMESRGCVETILLCVSFQELLLNAADDDKRDARITQRTDAVAAAVQKLFAATRPANIAVYSSFIAPRAEIADEAALAPPAVATGTAAAEDARVLATAVALAVQQASKADASNEQS